MSERVFPIDPGEDDPRFSIGLILDVAEVLSQHGYPSVSEYTSPDVSELYVAVFQGLGKVALMLVIGQSVRTARAVSVIGVERARTSS